MHTVPEPPPACERIIIVGAGGFGREVLLWAEHAWPGHVTAIAGFLSADPTRLEGTGCPLPILGDPEEFSPRPGDRFILGIGIPHVRRRVTEPLVRRKAVFLTLVHPTAIVAPTAHIGTGAVVAPQAIVSAAARLGDFAVLNYHASLAHDAAAGDFSVLSPYATLGGGARIGADVFLALRASVGPGKSVGDRGVVSAHSCVLFDAPPDALVYGVPGRLGPAVSIDRSPAAGASLPRASIRESQS